MRYALFVISLFLFSFSANASNAGFDAWKQQFIQRAEAKGLKPAQTRLVANAQLNERVIELYNRQPEVIRPAWQYITKRLSETRITKGIEKRIEHEGVLHQVEKQYPVPRGIMLAIWGIETNYGGYTGTLNTINSLATLSFASRRQAFFEGELLAVLKLLRDGYVTESDLVGSWAGALGQPQFMPSNIKRYAADFNGDGKADIWNNTGDVMASIANYLTKHKWQKGLVWGCPAVLTKKFDWQNFKRGEKMSRLEWQRRGVIAQDSACGLKADDEVKLIVPAGANASVFLVSKNFRVIRRYNNSQKYALAVALLSEEVEGKHYDLNWPTDEENIDIDDIPKVQARLNELGFNAGPADGKPGSKTKAALAAYQRSVGLIGDGYLSSSIVKRLLAN